MLAIVPVVLIFLGIAALLAGVVPAALTLAESGRMSESTTGTICGVTPHLIMDSHMDSMDMATNHTWTTLRVTAEVDVPTEAEGDSDAKTERELSVWVPEWYGPAKVGETISLVYDPAAPDICLAAEVREVLEEVTPMFARLGVAMTAIGFALAIALAIMGLV